DLRQRSQRGAFPDAGREDFSRNTVKIDSGTGGSRETSTGGSGSRPGRSAVDERGRESINFFSELKRRNVYKVAVAYASRERTRSRRHSYQIMKPECVA